MGEVRCKRCKRLLLKGQIEAGSIEIKCPKCSFLNQFSFVDAVSDKKVPAQESRSEPIAQTA